MHSRRSIEERQPSGSQARWATKRHNAIVITLFLAAILVSLAGAGVSNFSRPLQAHAQTLQSQTHAQTLQRPTADCHVVPADSKVVIANPSEAPLTAPTDANQIGLDPSAWITIELRYCPLYDSFFGRFTYHSPAENQPVQVNCDVENKVIAPSNPASNPYPYSTPPRDKQDGCQDANGNPITLSDGDSGDTPLVINDGNEWHTCVSDVDMSTGQTDKTICTDYAQVGIRAGGPPN